ncbi:zinc finger CCCH domain-containing protein 24 isoform X2 [Zea mays]|uniref:C3H1-type domain-containing protein n=2 Tax=Zea mays TaxID=4577 RepID=A0A804RHE8_MAIZE|nr:zinc finger CCCH domain-containing protein 24 isoform X2 [Zea mays]|eukprot:XP_008663006.1 zinc finger CCCH domain-containing protein 24 isoform X2 [Zea mays]
MEDVLTPPPQPELVGEKRKRDETSLDASIEDAPAAPASTGGAEDAAGSDVARHPMWKTSLCSYFRRRGAGAEECSHGESCRYAHTEEELRPRPDGTWDPTSDRAKKLRKVAAEAQEEAEEEVTVDEQSLEKCLVGLPMGWTADRLKPFLQDQGISYAIAKKKKGMTVGFVTFQSVEQLTNAVQILKKNPSGGKEIKIVDANRRSHQKAHDGALVSNTGTTTENGSSPTTPAEETSVLESVSSSKKGARDAVTPLANMTYIDQLEHKNQSMAQILKKLTRNARKACPPAIPHPDWVFKSKEIGGLPCKFEGILESPVVNGYRNKCEFSVGYSLEGKKTVGFMLGNFREGVTAVEEPVNCPNVSEISCKYAQMFQDFLQPSSFPLWSRIDNSGFWRQLTVREGRCPAEAVVSQNAESQISEVMLIVQVCSTGVDEALMKEEFDKLSAILIQGAATCSPPLPLTTIVVQDHKGISNAAPTDCPLIPLLVPKGDQLDGTTEDKIRIHDHISNLKFSLSPTAFFQVNTLAAERLYTLAGDWANLNSDTLLFDVCCGTGTIGLTLAQHVGMVVGIEMNESAVSNACRNALVNGIKNCRFVCGKAEDVMGPLLTEYLGSPQQQAAASKSNSEIDDASKNEDTIGCASYDGENIDSSKQRNDNAEGQQPMGASVDHPTCASEVDENNVASGEQNCGEASLVNDKPIETASDNSLEQGKACKDGSSSPNNNVLAANACQFKNVVAIVDSPRVGLRPTVRGWDRIIQVLSTVVPQNWRDEREHQSDQGIEDASTYSTSSVRFLQP